MVPYFKRQFLDDSENSTFGVLTLDIKTILTHSIEYDLLSLKLA